MAKNTLIDFKRLKPLTLDGVWYSDYGNGTGQYPFSNNNPTHFYYWLIDNIPFLRLNERDALFAHLMNLGYIAAFPYKNYASVNITDLTPVIVDMQNGYIHQDFSKQDLDKNETIGFVIANMTDSTFYTDENNIYYYYVVLNINNIILPFSRIQIAPSQTYSSLIPEQTKLYLDLRGQYCTLATLTEKVSRLNDSQTEVAIEVGTITRIDTSAKVCICNLSSSSSFGASTGLDDILHSNLEDIEAYEIKKSISEDLPELYVYGHYGYQTKIIKFSTPLNISLNVGSPVQINSNGNISTYTGTNQFLGFIYYKKILSNSIDYYIVMYGEYVVPNGSLEEGKTYFLNNQGNLIPEDSPDLSTTCIKIGPALSSNVLLLESNNTSFYLTFLTNLGITTFESTTKGEQIGLTLDSHGLPIHSKFLYNHGLYGRFPILNIPLIPGKPNANYMLYELGSSRNSLSLLKRPTFSFSFLDSTITSWASGWADNTADKPMYGFIHQPPKLFIQRLAPEYDNSGDVRFDRILIYLASTDINNYSFLNALDETATQNTNTWTPTFQSDLEAASHAISSLSVSALTYGATGELIVTLTSSSSDFTFTTPSVTGSSSGTKTYYPASKGISLKTKNGLIAFYNSTFTPVCSSTIYCFYEKVESTGIPKQYKFTNCNFFNTRSLSAIASNTNLSVTVQPNRVISIPTGSFTIKTGGASSPVIAGMFNPNPHLLTRFSKHIPFSCYAGYRYENGYDWVIRNGQLVLVNSNTWYSRRQVLSPLGLQPNYTFGSGTLANMSVFNNSVYSTLDASGNFSYPLYGTTGSGTALNQNLTIDTKYNFYRYIDIDTMYLNPHAPWSILSLITSELHDRYPIKLRLGCISEPYVKSFYDSFMFGNAQTITLGLCLRPTVSTNEYSDYREHKTIGVGTIVYVARQNVDAVEDYVDIHLDPSALAYQIMGDFGNHVPATGTVSSIDHPYNFDLICYVNGKEYAFGVNDTIRIWLPPNDFEEDIRFDRIKEISTRQKPYLVLTYTQYQIDRPPWINDLCYKWSSSITGPVLESKYAVGPVIPPHVGDGS